MRERENSSQEALLEKEKAFQQLRASLHAEQFQRQRASDVGHGVGNAFSRRDLDAERSRRDKREK